MSNVFGVRPTVVDKVDLAKFIKLPNPSYERNAATLERGYPDDIRTAFWQRNNVHLPRSKVADAWRRVLTASREMKEWPELLAYEDEQYHKIGPISVAKPLSNRIDQIKLYFQAVTEPATPFSDAVVAATVEGWGKLSIRLIDIKEVWAKTRHKSTSSGPPLMESKRSAYDKSIPVSLELKDNTYYEHLPFGVFQSAYELFTRTQAGGPSMSDVKTRDIWGGSLGSVLFEGQYYQPNIEQIQRHKYVAAQVSLREVEKRVTRAFASKPKHQVVIGTDFSKFDAHFNPVMQKAVSDCIGQWGRDCDEWREKIFPYKYEAPLLAGPYLFVGSHGLASGSRGTASDGDTGHKLFQYAAAIANGEELNEFSDVRGDDGYLTFPGITVKKVIEEYTKHGQVLNPDKQYVSDHSLIYLRRYYNVNYLDDEGVMLGVYPTMRALNSLLGQERYYDPKVWSAEMVELRALSILENCANHPMFIPFVDFVMKGDKFRLGLDLPGFLDSLSGWVEKAEANFDDFLGFNKSQMAEKKGINDWAVVQYLQSLARK